MRSLLIILTILSASPAIAKNKDGAPADPNKKTCRAQENTGSLFTTRVCHTAAEWQAIDESNKNAARNFDDKKTTGGVKL